MTDTLFPQRNFSPLSIGDLVSVLGSHSNYREVFLILSEGKGQSLWEKTWLHKAFSLTSNKVVDIYYPESKIQQRGPYELKWTILNKL